MTGRTFDLGPQALIVARLAEGVTDEHFDGVTPCPDCAVRNILGHPAGLSAGLLDAAAQDPTRGGGIFGPVVPVSDDGPLLDRVIGLGGRDPGWKP